MRRAVSRVSMLGLGAILCARLLLAGANPWIQAGPYRHGGELTVVAVDPLSTTTVYAGTASGPYKSTDGGQTWKPINDGLPSLFVLDLAVDPITTSTLYAAAGGGVYKSTDGGQSWNLSLYLPPEGQNGTIAIDPTDPQTVYVSSQFGIHKSEDGGANWQWASDGLESVGRVAIDPSAPAILYAPSGSVSKSVDGGAHWVSMGLQDTYAVRIDPRSPSTVYALSVAGVFKSTDGASTWAPINDGLPTDFQPVDLAVDPDSSETLYLTAGGNGVFKSTNGGSAWTATSQGLPDALVRYVTAMAIVPQRPTTIYLCNQALEGGLFKSQDAGAHWSDTSGAFTPASVREVASAAPSPAVYAATDGGVFRTMDGGNHWQAVDAGLSELDIRGVVPDPQLASTVYARGTTRLFKTTDGAASWTTLAFGPASGSSSDPYILALAIDPRAGSTLYVSSADRKFWKSIDGGQTWTASQPFPEAVTSIAVDPHDSSVVFAGANGGGIFRSTDAGSTWTAVFAIPDASSVDAIAIDPGGSIIYAGWSGVPPPLFPPAGGVFQSTDGGATWTSIQEGLGVNALAIDPRTPSIVYVAMQRGQLVRSTDSGATFHNVAGLPDAFLSSIAMNPALPTTVYVAAGGDGAFRASFAPYTACSPDATTLCLNDGRFRVTVGWQRTPSGPTAQAHTVPVTSDSGYFWFLEEDNVELMVKVLDGRSVTGAFWVFYGSLTSLGCTITVVDTVTGESKDYVKAPGALSSEADTHAFPDNGPGSLLGLPAPSSIDAAATPTEPCVPDGRTLCLNGGRFRVQIVWQASPSGPLGTGQTIPLTDDTGAFWFLDPANIEVVVKVLDARPVNGHFWVFYGSLSNLDYLITVTDTETGEVRTYHNPRGTLEGGADTSAF